MLHYQNGNFSAFNELYSRYSRRIYGFLRSKTTSPEEANDITQAAFLKFHQSRNQYSNKYPLASWIFTITRSVLIDHYRKKKDVPLTLQQEMGLASPEPEDSSVENDLILRASEVIKSLDSDQKQLLNFRFHDGLSYAEISKKLGVSSDTLRKRMSRTLNFLRGGEK